MALLATILVCTELVARVLLAPVGNHLWAYNSSTNPIPFEWFRVLSKEDRTPTVVVIGDSTAARNVDPATVEESSEVPGVYSLAYAGNFPGALRGNTLPLLDTENAPEIVLLFQWPGSLRADPRVDQIEAGAISPILEARRTGRILTSEYLYVTRLFPARRYLVDYWIRDEELIHAPKKSGFAPFPRPIEQQREMTLTRTIGENAVFSEERREIIRELIAIADKRDFLLIVVVGPFKSGDQYRAASQHLEWLRDREEEACEHLLVMDLRQMPGIGPELFKDNHHLYAEGAQLFSTALGQEVARIRSERSADRTACELARTGGRDSASDEHEPAAVGSV